MAISLKSVKTVSGWVDPFITCASILAAYAAFSRLAVSDRTLAVLMVAVLVAVMGLLEWIRAPGAPKPYPIKESLKHTLIVWAGTLVGFVLIILSWDLLAEYRRGYYAPFFDTLPLLIGLTPLLAALFIFLGIRARGPSGRGGYQLGLIAFGRLSEVDGRLLVDDLLGWFLRAFFLPINFVEIVWTIGVFRGHELALLGGSWVAAEYYLLIILYGLIVAAVTPGYLFGSRLIHTETTAVSRSWFGWTVTLACYAPFAAAFFGAWFDYTPATPNPKWATPWVLHLGAFPPVLALVGGAILLLTLIHLWGEAQFNLRSSNLANRGIITAGPYRFTKHPVYVAKCIAWLLIWLPFVSGIGVLDDVRLTILWMGVCGIYGLRALAEEQLLAADPNYVTYALWMDEHGLFRSLGHLIPPISFKWRLGYWRNHARPDEEYGEPVHG